MKIGFVGFGEAAYNISAGLAGEGVRDIVGFDSMAEDPAMGGLIRDRAKEAQVTLLPSVEELVRSVDVVFASVPSTYTLGVCKAARDHLRYGQFYVDVSASTPAIKKQIWDMVKDKEVLFVDAAMLGSLPKDKHQVPISASGNGAAAFQKLMTPYGMKITLEGEEAGAASAIKLVRSIFMKGLSTLMIETLQAGDAYGVENEVVTSIAKSLDGIPFTSHLDRLVTGSAIHCSRRAHELEGSIDMLEEAGLPFAMTAAARERLAGLEPYDFPKRYIEKKPAGWQDIIQVLKG